MCETMMCEESVAMAVQRVECIDLQPSGDSFLEDVQHGLAQTPKTLPCKYFYDERGSELFEEITTLPEYYPTRTEIAIMRRWIGEIIQRCNSDVRLVELGSGASVKTRIVLEALQRAGIRVQYVPIDISRDFLFKTAQDIAQQFPHIEVRAVCADYTQGLSWLGNQEGNAQTVVYFPGSTLGNFTREEARQFVANIREQLQTGDGFLLGTDLKKDSAIIHAAYNDAQGVTAQFNVHLLERINDELEATIPVRDYEHDAVYNSADGRIEMYLRSASNHTISVGERSFAIQRGEAILTEYSHKFDSVQIRALADATGFVVEYTWMDEAGLFGVHWLTAG